MNGSELRIISWQLSLTFLLLGPLGRLFYSVQMLYGMMHCSCLDVINEPKEEEHVLLINAEQAHSVALVTSKSVRLASCVQCFGLGPTSVCTQDILTNI